MTDAALRVDGSGGWRLTKGTALQSAQLKGASVIPAPLLVLSPSSYLDMLCPCAFSHSLILSASTPSHRPSAMAAAAAPSRLLIAPYTPPRDVQVWNLTTKRWLRIELGNELDPTANWLCDMIERRLGADVHGVRLFVGGSGQLLSPADLERSLDYFIFGQSAGNKHELSSRVDQSFDQSSLRGR